jgi:hypothetical protein
MSDGGDQTALAGAAVTTVAASRANTVAEPMNVLRRAVFDLRRVDFDQWGVVPAAIP